MGIADALNRVREEIRSASVACGRNPDDIKLVAVTKTVGLQAIAEAVQAGVTIIGENRVQEAQKKIQDSKFKIQDRLHPPTAGDRAMTGAIQWHLIGHLQKNKARLAVQLFDLIHTVDSAALAAGIDRHAGEAGKLQRVLIQVKLEDEPSKHGIAEDEYMKLLEEIDAMHNLKPEGLMTIPPYFEDPEKARIYFRRLRFMRDRALQRGFHVPELSMGMSGDFAVAIEEGATMVRIGTAIFGQRTQNIA